MITCLGIYNFDWVNKCSGMKVVLLYRVVLPTGSSVRCLKLVDNPIDYLKVDEAFIELYERLWLSPFDSMP